MEQPTWSIRGWLGILIAAVALPLLVLLVTTFLWEVRREQAEARDSALRIAKSTAERIVAQHESSERLLRQMALRPAIREYDGRTCDSLFAIVDFFPQWADFLFYDARGAVVCSAGPAGDDVAVSLAAQQAMAAELRSGATLPQTPMVRWLRGRWVSIVTRPVTRGDGTLIGTLALVQLLDFAPDPALLPNATVTILDRTGVVVARSSRGGELAGRNVGSVEVAKIALAQREGRAKARGVDGVSREYGFTTIPSLGWTVSAGLPTEDVMRPVQETFLVGIAGFALILVLITTVASILWRRISQPLRALVKATEAVATAGYGRAETAGGPREIARLSAAFNDMVESRAHAEARTADSERNLKALSERLLNVQEHERMRVAREIHDDLGQALTALKMDVIGLLQRSRHTPDAEPMVERILATIESTVTAVQRISSELRPSVLDDLGLFTALESEARLFEERSGIECELSLPDELPEVTTASATAIYRIVQEALTNVARHSNAGRVEIRVRKVVDELFVEIRDDGRGIEPADLHDPSSFGLAGIRERADMLGGSAVIEGVAGLGTIVSIRMPAAAREGSDR